MTLLKNIVLSFFIMTASLVHAKDGKIDDVTGKDSQVARGEFFDAEKKPGFRLAWLGMKEKNGVHGIGEVNDAIDAYEKNIYKAFSENLPGVDVTITKTDFKGYYITCNPSITCEGKGIIERVVNKMEPVTLGKDPKPFDLIVTEADNYKEGYVKARVLAEYPKYDNNGKLNVDYFDPKKEKLESFIDRKMKSAMLEATGLDDLSKLNTQDPDFMKALEVDIDYYRAGDFDKMENPKFKELIRGLDNLLEVPFANSENIDDALEAAVKNFDISNKDIGYHTMQAQTGDDLFMVVHKVEEVQKVVDGKTVIKKESKVVRVIGADAKGLGRANITSRFIQFGNMFKSGKSLDGMNQIVSASKDAIHQVNTDMANSMNSYADSINHVLDIETQKLNGAIPKGVVTSEFGPTRPTIKTLDQVIAAANGEYIKKTNTDGTLMEMRAGSICNCDGEEVKVVMNQITATHNRLKLMEKAGYPGHFGTSCIGVEYWVRKLGIPVN